MRLVAAVCCLSIALLAAAPAQAEGVNNLRAGVNGLLTAPFDPVALMITPSDEFEDYPAFPVTGRILGLPVGIAQGAQRAGMAVFDIVMSPLFIFPTMGPEARYTLIEAEYDY